MGGALTGVELGVDHVVSADAPQDASVGAGDGLGPDLGRLQVHEVAGDEDGGLQGGRHPHDRRAELGGAQLLQGLHVRGVGLHQRDAAGPLAHDRRIGLHGQHLAPEPVQGGGNSGAEASQPDDKRGVGARGWGGHEVS